jgi:hypothetical protein
LRASAPEELAQLLAEAERLRKSHGAFLRPFEAWAKLAAALAEVSREKAIRECPEAAQFVYLLYQLVADGEVHSRSRGGPLRALESMIATLRVSARHGDRKGARERVRELWQREGGGYESKSDFARVMARRLLIETGLEVTDRTIREDWLRGLSYPGSRVPVVL